jgi:hypothetical protein
VLIEFTLNAILEAGTGGGDGVVVAKELVILGDFTLAFA